MLAPFSMKIQGLQRSDPGVADGGDVLVVATTSTIGVASLHALSGVRMHFGLGDGGARSKRVGRALMFRWYGG
jgi:hypothetical protein